MKVIKNISIDSEHFEEWLRSTGFLFPVTEIELLRFDKLFEDYDFKLKDITIDPMKIINGTICSIRPQKLIISKEDLSDEIPQLKMAARKGEELPQHIIDKMRKKHKKDDSKK